MLYKELLTSLPNSQGIKTENLIKIQNVADYWFINAPDEFDSKSFPNIAPPFEKFWMEYCFTPEMLKMGGKIIPEEVGARIGVLFSSIKAEPETGGVKVFFEDGTGFDVASGWVTQAKMIIEKRGELLSSYEFVYSVSPLGEIVKHSELGGHIAIRGNDVALKEGVVSLLYSLIAPCLLSLSFMHCKNVTMVERGEKREYQPRRRNPTIKHYVLDIEPMKRVLKSDGAIETTGIKHALHICRGHFKNYQGGGLFGKYKGMYWWDSQVRGKRELGEVHKQYRVGEPK